VVAAVVEKVKCRRRKRGHGRKGGGGVDTKERGDNARKKRGKRN
jgi:hypothetical protein